MQVVNHIEIRDDTAYVAGRNVKAKMVARMVVREKASVEQVVEQYSLTPAEVHAALAYYYDNQAVLDAEYEANIAQLKQTGTSFENFKAQIAAREADDAE